METKEEIVQSHVNALAEHFDAVQIMCSLLNENGETNYVFIGSGNTFARTGMAERFHAFEDENDRDRIRGSRKET